MYYAENNAIRRITAQGRVSTVATISALAGGPSIPGTNAHPYLRGLAVDARGVLYVADNGDARVLKITPNGKVTTLLQLQSAWSPTAVALLGSDVYVLEYLHTAGEERREWLARQENHSGREDNNPRDHRSLTGCRGLVEFSMMERGGHSLTSDFGEKDFTGKSKGHSREWPFRVFEERCFPSS